RACSRFRRCDCSPVRGILRLVSPRSGVREEELAHIALGAILALALLLRFHSLDRLLPHSTEPDNDAAHQVYLLEAHVPPHERPGVYARYPLLLASLARWLPSATSPAGDDLESHWHAA